MMWTEIEAHISQKTGANFHSSHRRSVSGGCINQGYAVSDGQNTYFVKLNQASQIAMFEAEALGLQQMFDTATIRVPKPICWGTAGNSGYLVLEWLQMGSGNTNSWEEMGRKLAAMHKWNPPQSPLDQGGSKSNPPQSPLDQGGSKSNPPQSPLDQGGSKSNPPQSLLDQGGSKGGFGWDMNNTIGSTPQINTWTCDWAEFYTKHRLGYQFQLGRRRGGRFPQAEELLAAIPELLASHEPQPSLVHGDLWGGNAGCTVEGEPVIFDPATYFGDREVDIAMTELFGGFPTAFYRGYNEVFPLESGYEQRKILYNLYHVVNHFNLFGGGYESQANGMIARLLR